jgi:ribosomal protein S18 acetylase RimI-like enzyme
MWTSFQPAKMINTLNSSAGYVPVNENLKKESIQITFAALGDLDSLVALHMRCFSERDHIAVLFGEDFIRAAFKWFITDAGTFVLVAKQDNNLVGFTAVADGSYDGPMLRAGKWEAIRALIRRPWLALHPDLLLRLYRKMFTKPKSFLVGKVAHIAFTAVDTQLRGLGIGKALKNESIRVCRERGSTSILTGVRRQNLRAKALNENAGFIEISELSTKRFIYLMKKLDRDDSST